MRAVQSLALPQACFFEFWRLDVMQAQGTRLDIEGAAKRFGDFTALHAINLSVAGGELIALLGPSGCGKTTLLRIVAGFVNQDRGMSGSMAWRWIICGPTAGALGSCSRIMRCFRT